MAGSRLAKLISQEKPLQIVGVIHACAALLAEQAGFKALYLSGAGVSNSVFGLPDLEMVTFAEMNEAIRRITAVSTLPLLVDGDTGGGSVLTIARMVKEFIRSGAAGVHIEDQSWPKRCGHRDGKSLVPSEVMVDRIKAAVDAKTDSHFTLMARTDAYGIEPVEAVLERSHQYVAAGADMIFIDAVTTLEDYQTFCQALKVPVLANITEFGKTPLFALQELKQAGVSLALYPLSAFRAMNHAALQVYETIKKEGSQKKVLELMQTRDQLYKLLNYYEFEKKIIP